MAKNRKYILGDGIAISPEKDVALLKKMSKQGWHISGTTLSWYRFDKGEPADYDYAFNMESKVTKDMLSLYEESGWLPIVACDGFQIFRAAEGATPIFSDLESEVEALEEVKRRTLKPVFFWGLSLIAIELLSWTVFSTRHDTGHLMCAMRVLLSVLGLFCAAPFIFNIVCLFGISRILRKKRKQGINAN